MTAYIIRRLLYTIPIVLGVILVLFLIFNVVGGNPVRVMLGKNPDKRQVRDIEHQLQLDLPLILNLDVLTAGRGRARALETLDRIAATGSAPAELVIDAAIYADAEWLDHSPRYSVPALMGVLLDEAAPPERRAWASFGLEHVTGERIRWRAGKPDAERSAALARWTRWWTARQSWPAYDPGWRHLLQSQMFHFVWQALTFDFGRSLMTKQSIRDMIFRGAPRSLAITVPGFFIEMVISLALALICAFMRGGLTDRTLVVVSVLGMSITSLAYIIAGQYFLAYQLGLFPVHGWQPPYLTYLMLPVLIFVIAGLGPNLRFFRTVILDEVNQDYVRTARAKGLSNAAVMLKHVLKNSMIPIITYTVIALPFLYLGSLLLERFFGIPGLGGTTVNAIFTSDFPVVRAFTYIGAVLFVLGNLATDICYALVDPRISLK